MPRALTGPQTAWNPALVQHRVSTRHGRTYGAGLALLVDGPTDEVFGTDRQRDDRFVLKTKKSC